jgi:hypothetical protein
VELTVGQRAGRSAAQRCEELADVIDHQVGCVVGGVVPAAIGVVPGDDVCWCSAKVLIELRSFGNCATPTGTVVASAGGALSLVFEHGMRLKTNWAALTLSPLPQSGER